MIGKKPEFTREEAKTYSDAIVKNDKVVLKKLAIKMMDAHFYYSQLPEECCTKCKNMMPAILFVPQTFMEAAEFPVSKGIVCAPCISDWYFQRMNPISKFVALSLEAKAREINAEVRDELVSVN